MTSAQASELLDRVLDQQLLDVIDLEALMVFQGQLYMSLCDCGVEEVEATQRSRVMICDALGRLARNFVESADDPRPQSD